MSERMRFVLRHEEGERMAELCREFGISRKTGYKLLERYKEQGPPGLFDLPRRPHRLAKRTDARIQELLLASKHEHPTWGPRKLLAWLRKRQPGVSLPAASTVGELFRRHGLVKRRRLRRDVPPHQGRLREADAPNDIWCVDYKGQFRMGDGKYCYPLTVTDQFSRYLLACEGFEAIDGGAARAVFERLFTVHGVPWVIRSDNGVPFASRGLWGLSRLSVWWMKHGVMPERIKAGHPEQNGRHERMHRTLKAETARPSAANLLQQQERFDQFAETFNHERPHEALAQRCPAEVYQSLTRPWPKGELDYPLHDDVRRVSQSGHLRIMRRRDASVFLSSALAGEQVGIRELDDGRFLVTFANLDLGWAHTNPIRFEGSDEERNGS